MPRKQWEYNIINIKYKDDGDIMKSLNYYGDRGWEAVNVQSIGENKIEVIIKREK